MEKDTVKSTTEPYVEKEGKHLNNGGGSLVLEGHENWFGAGHNSTYTFEGKDYIIFHSYEKKYNGASKLKVAELEWDAELWPVLGKIY